MSDKERLPAYILDTLKEEISYCSLRIDELKRQGGGRFTIPIYEDQIIKMQKVLDDNKEELKDDQKT